MLQSRVKLIQRMSRRTATFKGFNNSTSGMSYLGDYVRRVFGERNGHVCGSVQAGKSSNTSKDITTGCRIDEVGRRLFGLEAMRVMWCDRSEAPPKWGGQPGPALYDAFNKFAAAAVEHFKTRIQYWDVYNEVDSKYLLQYGLRQN